jgi:putative DNA primase/helicase
LLQGFPTVSEVDQAVALSALISPVVRGALGVVPMHAFRASTAGTGKTYLVDVVSTIATGRPCPVATVAQSEEETEKRLAGLLLAAFPLICLDNVNGELGGDLLCQAIERPIVQIRPLGTSDIIEIETRASIFATGNSLRVRGDMTRRSLVCNLDAGVERPELRSFDFDPVEEVLTNRSAYVGAVLTIVLAHAAAGFPGAKTPLASFQEWSRYVRGALMWLGCADPCASMEEAREDDPELSELVELLDAWRSEFGTVGSFTVPEIISMVSERYADEEDGRPGGFRHPRMREFVARIANMRGAMDGRKLGLSLRAKEGRIVQGHRLRRNGKGHGNVFRWNVYAV